jgi:hypothetical protein
LGRSGSKKQKRRSEVRESESLDEKIEEDRSTRIWIMDNSTSGIKTNECFGAPHGKKGKTGWRSPENPGQVDLGF